MNPTIELVYSPDCPNVDLARTRLQEALSRVGIEPRWVEWNRVSASAPAHARRFGSPTVLINGRDVAGIAETEADCCRVYADAEGLERAPTVEVLEIAVRRAQQRANLSAWAKRIGLTLLGASTFETPRTDLSRHKWISFLLWRLPLLLLAAGAFWEPGAKAVASQGIRAEDQESNTRSAEEWQRHIGDQFAAYAEAWGSSPGEAGLHRLGVEADRRIRGERVANMSLVGFLAVNFVGSMKTMPDAIAQYEITDSG